MSHIEQDDITRLLRAVNSNSLRVKQLSVILSSLGLSKHGVKAEQQKRLTQLIQDLVNNKNVAVFYQIMTDVWAMLNRPSPIPPPASNSSELLNSHNQNMERLSPSIHRRERTSDEVRISHKPNWISGSNSLGNKLNIFLRSTDQPRLDDMANDDRLRIFILCTDNFAPNSDIAFPNQCHIRVNNHDLRLNLRGVKKRPGSTRPADITQYLRIRPNYINKIQFTYDEPIKTFYVLTKTLDDPDIEATSQILSLKCPLSYSRLQLPCRGISCRHNQCFDVNSYLLLQQQAPTWQCPICNNYTPFSELAIDQYVQEILETTAPSLEQVIIEPTGEWRVPTLKLDNTPIEAANNDADLICEGTAPADHSGPSSETGALLQPAPFNMTSRENTNGGAGTKRKILIDLTFSDDEDDCENEPRVKRQATIPLSAPSVISSEMVSGTDMALGINTVPSTGLLNYGTNMSANGVSHIPDQFHSWYASQPQYTPQSDDYEN
ncbi:E3 SUMO-protein ligase pli1 [Ceratocystis pirilliformis]|uniref:E3 SUMO-protein ligase pli1 n=1 Tax=Ceratocystis pirilliformis TaxID=259994 RepID=A0ABR3Z588_9PEZI